MDGLERWRILRLCRGRHPADRAGPGDRYRSAHSATLVPPLPNRRYGRARATAPEGCLESAHTGRARGVRRTYRADPPAAKHRYAAPAHGYRSRALGLSTPELRDGAQHCRRPGSGVSGTRAGGGLPRSPRTGVPPPCREAERDMAGRPHRTRHPYHRRGRQARTALVSVGGVRVCRRGPAVP